MTATTNTSRLRIGSKPAKPIPRWNTAVNPPAKPASAPENANAASFERTGLIAYADAPRSLSRTATTARPARLRRKFRARSTATTSAPRQR